MINRKSPIPLFTGLITIGETRSPIFLKITTANAQNIALSKEKISPMCGITCIYNLDYMAPENCFEIKLD